VENMVGDGQKLITRLLVDLWRFFDLDNIRMKFDQNQVSKLLDI